MTFILVIFTALTLNANGLRDPCKWTELWSEINRTDVICIQETHLDTNQEFAFCLYAQGYNYFFSHGTTASAGVLVVVRRCSGYQVVKVGRYLVIWLLLTYETLEVWYVWLVCMLHLTLGLVLISF